MKKLRLSKRKLKKIKTLEQMEEMFHFVASQSEVYIHPETYAEVFNNIKNYYEAIMPKTFLGSMSRAKAQLEVMRTDFHLDTSLPKNRIIIKQKNEVE